MRDYSHHQCCKCASSAVGVYYEDNVTRTYYCNRHFYARSSVEDKIQDAKEFEQWKHHAWYQEAFPEKFGIGESAIEEQYKRFKERQTKLF